MRRGWGRFGLAVFLVGALGLASSGCSSSNGTIDGVFYGMGKSVTAGGGVPSSGSIAVTGTHATYRTAARSDGEFVVGVPAGSYRITGRDIGQTGGLPGCGSRIVHVSPGQITHVSVTCVFH